MEMCFKKNKQKKKVGPIILSLLRYGEHIRSFDASAMQEPFKVYWSAVRRKGELCHPAAWQSNS